MKIRNHQICHLVLLCLFMFFSGSLSAAETGTIAGNVYDADSDTPLPGANIYLAGSALGSSTDIDGAYVILNVPEGNYTMYIEYVGYETQNVSIRVNAGEKVVRDAKLQFAVLAGEVITITAQRLGQAAAINQQLTANSIMNVVASDRIQELPDQNVAESIGRIPGVSVTRNAGEANKIVIRGLEPKLNAITVNGVKIPSTSAGDRSVDLSMITSELLEGIEVFKAPTPDMDAEAVGGVVNLKVKKAPEERKMMLKLNSGYNQLNNDWGNYKGIGEFSQRFLDQSLGLIIGFNLERANRGSEKFGGGYTILGLADSITGELPIGGTNINIQNTEEIRKRWGGNFTLDYAFDEGKIWMTNFYSATNRDIFQVQKTFDPSRNEVNYDATANEIDLKALSSSLNGENHLMGIDLDWALSRYDARTNNDYQFNLKFDESSPFNGSLLDPNDNTTYMDAANNNLDKTYLRSAAFSPDQTSQTNYTAQLNLNIPVNFTENVAGFIKFGGKFTRTDRDRTTSEMAEKFYYLGSSYVRDAQANHPTSLILIPDNDKISIRNFINSNADPDYIVNEEFALYPIFNEDNVRQWYDYHKQEFHSNYERYSNNYDLRESIGAGYIMAKLNFGQFLTVIPGIRYEYSDNVYNSMWTSVSGQYGEQGIQIDTSAAIKYGHWFPHLHVQWRPLTWFDLRLSANKTLARPDYLWISPRTRLDATNARITRGNPELIEAKSWNYDISASFHSNSIGLFTIGGYFKQLKDIFYEQSSVVFKPEDIEKLGIPGREGGYIMSSYSNSDEARVWGIEVDLQTQLRFVPGLPSFLQGIVLNANYSYIHSETYFPFYKLSSEIDFTKFPPVVIYKYQEWEREGPMPGQSKHIANISLGYDIGGLSARLSILYQGASINSVGEIAETDRWNDDFWRWDASVKYRLTNFISFNMNLVNISGQPDRAFYGKENYPTNRFYYGMTGSAGIELTY